MWRSTVPGFCAPAPLLGHMTARLAQHGMLGPGAIAMPTKLLATLPLPPFVSTGPAGLQASKEGPPVQHSLRLHGTEH